MLHDEIDQVRTCDTFCRFKRMALRHSIKSICIQEIPGWSKCMDKLLMDRAGAMVYRARGVLVFEEISRKWSEMSPCPKLRCWEEQRSKGLNFRNSFQWEGKTVNHVILYLKSSTTPYIKVPKPLNTASTCVPSQPSTRFGQPCLSPWGIKQLNWNVLTSSEAKTQLTRLVR